MNTILDIDGLVDCCEGFGDLCKSVRGEVREFVKSFGCYPSFFTVGKENFDVVSSLMGDWFDSRAVSFVCDGVSSGCCDLVLEGREVVCRG